MVWLKLTCETDGIFRSNVRSARSDLLCSRRRHRRKNDWSSEDIIDARLHQVSNNRQTGGTKMSEQNKKQEYFKSATQFNNQM